MGRHHSLEKTNPIPHLHVHVHVHYPCIVSAASLIKSLIYSFVLFQGWLTCSSCGYRTRTGLSCPVCGPKEEAVLREEVREREREESEKYYVFFVFSTLALIFMHNSALSGIFSFHKVVLLIIILNYTLPPSFTPLFSRS